MDDEHVKVATTVLGTHREGSRQKDTSRGVDGVGSVVQVLPELQLGNHHHHLPLPLGHGSQTSKNALKSRVISDVTSLDVRKGRGRGRLLSPDSASHRRGWLGRWRLAGLAGVVHCRAAGWLVGGNPRNEH